MVDFGNVSKDRWVCPSDRQLALRAKLRTGWSVKTRQLQSFGGRQDSTLNESEQAVIKDVIKRAEMLEMTEQERVGRLVERLENMKRAAMGNGTNQCILCGDSFGVLGSASLICHDCKKAVCQKCGIETMSAQKEPISLCKICSETREMWKKSGAWFFKGLPKYVLPEKKSNPDSGRYGGRKIQRPGLEKNSWSRGSGGHEYLQSANITSSSTNSTTPTLKSTPAGSKLVCGKGSGEYEEESSSEDEINRRARQARGRHMDDTEAGGSHHSLRRQGSCVTFDPTLGPMSGSLLSQRSESLSLTSDGEITGDLHSYSDSDKLGHHFGNMRDYSRSRESLASSVNFSRQAGCNLPDSTCSRMDASQPHLDQSCDHRQNAGTDMENNLSLHSHNVAASPYLHMRRDSQGSNISREWYWSEDRASLSGSSASGHRTASSSCGGADVVEDSADASVMENVNLGMLELTLLYNPVTSALTCSLHRAKGLRPMDINGLSDPFCRLNILPTGGKSNRLRTKTVHKTRNPEFNETLTFYGVTDGDVGRKLLHILILDDDKYGHDFIGEARIPLIHLKPQEPKHMNIYLEKHYPVEEEDEVWGNDTWAHGQILVTLCYSTRRRALVVGIVRCINLQPMDNNGFSDPFVKLRLKPDPFHRKYKTSVKWKNLNPVFNEEFVFDTKMTELPKQALEITVWDKDYGKSNDYLGGLQLGWHSKGERLKHWVDMIKFPDHKHEGWHNLGEDMLSD
ncbi:rabphilin-1 isoform X2 [Zootermopsis nevadensis]|uniref:rabphilin-1 isoform X2 n=1 Tax=Zootermopsis nevadensis TaxID=136037 RepID=UPI000B8E5FED|nr:rabphilin-1 isoform X2 [Zootermopsis nevadensis]